MSQKKRVFGMAAVSALGLILLFQNCSTGEYGLYGSRSSSPFFCHDEHVCREDSDQLWVDLGSVYPVYMRSEQIIAGECNDGGFPGNRIQYQVIETKSSTERKLAEGVTTCDPKGRFSFRVKLCEKYYKLEKDCHDALSDRNLSFFVAVKITGIDQLGEIRENLRYPAEMETPLSILALQ